MSSRRLGRCRGRSNAATKDLPVRNRNWAYESRFVRNEDAPLVRGMHFRRLPLGLPRQRNVQAVTQSL